jgi:hypothetical protein
VPGYLLTMSAAIVCSHGGKGNLTAPNPRVKIMGQPVPMIAPPVMVAGCSNPPPPANVGPCVSALWIPPTGTARVKSMGQPLLCQSSQTTPAIPTGTPLNIVFAGQARVKGM